MKIPKLRANHLLKITDLSEKEILSLFKFSAALKKCQRNGKPHNLLKNKVLGMIFEKSSTRTRVSFESGIFQLGGTGLFLGKNDLQIGRGEPLEDTARVLSRYIDGIMIRTFEHEKVETLAKYSTIPVINGLTDDYHPCQVLADYFTMYEHDTTLKGQKLTYIGDGNNMAHSLMLGGAILGVDVTVAAPQGYMPSESVVAETKEIAKRSGSTIVVTDNIDEAVKGATYLYTDVWASMGQEEESEERKKHFADFCITSSLVKKAAPNAKIMHCLPAHRGEEITNEVIESKNSIVFDEAENRMHVQKAVMAALMNKTR